jgi:superfamily II DNA or RNA helicase
MTWKQQISAKIVESVGGIGVLDLFPTALKEYLLANECEAVTDPYLIAGVYVDVGGFKIFEDKSFRRMLIEGLDNEGLVELGNLLDVDTSKSRDIRSTIADQKWNWKATNAQKFCDFFKAGGAYNEALAHIESETKSERITSSIDSSYDQFYELHTYQSHIRDEVIQRLSLRNQQKVLIQLPTGAGKTRVGVHTAIRYLLRQDSRKHILWLAYQPLLLKQALETFEEIWPILGIGPISVGQYYGGINTLNLDAEKSITFANVSVLLNGCDDKLKNMLREKLCLIIFDEAHQAIADNAKALLTSLTTNESVKLIGLTATPGRGADDFAETSRLVQFFNGNRVEITPPVSKSFIGSANDIGKTMRERASAIRWLQSIGVLAELEHHLLKVEQTTELAADPHNDAYTATLLKAIANDAVRNELIVSKLIELNRDKKKVLVFACSVEHAKNLVTILKIKGVRAGLVTGENTETRTTVLEKFTNTEELNILVNYEVLTTGFDAPILNALLIARPTSSVVTYSQMLGRALRGPLNGGHNKNQIYNIQSPYYGNEIDAYHYFSNYWK